MRGHVRKRTHTTKAGKTTTAWYVVVDLPRGQDGRRRQKWLGGFRTRREAEAAQARFIHDLTSGDFIEESNLTLAQWVDQHWLGSVRMRVKSTTYESYRGHLHVHVLPRIGDLRIADVTPSALTSLYAELFATGRTRDGTGLSAKTV